MTEIIFVVEDAPEEGYLARAIGESIFTQAESVSELHERVRDAVQCHFDVGMGPKLIRLHFVRDQVIAHEVAVRSLKRSAVSAIAS